MNRLLKEILHVIAAGTPVWKNIKSRRLKEIFNECIERLQQGDTIENCLRSYPDVAADLEVLLKTTLSVNWRGSMVQPRPEFKAHARSQIIGALRFAAGVQETRRQPAFFSLQRAWVPALAVVLLLVFSSVGTAAAASNTMPDEPLYPAKIATEQVQLTLAFSNEAKAELNVKLAETRSQEIATMASQGKTEQVIATTERLAQNLDAAEAAIYKIEEAQTGRILLTTPALGPSTADAPEKPPDTAMQEESQFIPSQEEATVTESEELRKSLNAGISNNLETLEKVKDKAPEQAKEALQKAIDMAKNKQNKLNESSIKAEPKVPGNSGSNHKGLDPAKNGGN